MVQPEPIALELDADAALRSGLVALALALTGRVPVEETLAVVADITSQAVLGADGAGVTLFHSNAPPTIVASTGFVRDIDTIQYDLGQGPSLSAVAEGRVVRSGSLRTDVRWPELAHRVGELDDQVPFSALTMPLRQPERVIGSLTVYARAADAFDDDAVRRGAELAAAASAAVSNSQLLAEAYRYVGQLEQAMTSRATIDQAIGIVRSRTGVTAEEALDSMRVISQRENRRLSAVAEKLVGQAASRARSRRLSDANARSRGGSG